MKILLALLISTLGVAAQQQFAIVRGTNVVKILPPGENPTSFKFSKVIITNVVPAINPATEYIPLFQNPTNVVELTNGIPARLRRTYAKATKSATQLELEVDQAAVDYAKATTAIATLIQWQDTLAVANSPSNADFQNAVRYQTRLLEQLVRYLRRDIPPPAE